MTQEPQLSTWIARILVRDLTGRPGQIHAVGFGDLVTSGDDTNRA
jgi:hypothetical protein